MAFNPKSWGEDEAPTAAEMNRCKDSLNALYNWLVACLGANCVGQTGLGLYVVNFNLIDPGAASGTGDYGATWTKLWALGNAWAMEIAFPESIFSSKPYVLGHTTGSEDNWGIIPVSRWGESASGYRVAIRDTGGAEYTITGGFSYTALLIGPRKSNLT